MSDDLRSAIAPDADLARPVSREVRPLLWSVKRELWENRSIVVAPLAMSVFAVAGFMVSTIGMPGRRRAVLELALEQQRAAIGQPYDFAATALFATSFFVAFFYCLDALYGERRDRSILFWKSLPVSDRTVVFSKAVVAMAVLPAIAFTLALLTQLMMLLWSTVVLFPSGLAASTWTRIPWGQNTIIMLYGFVIVTLWHAPIYGWLTVVSAAVRRAAVLWAVLPIVVIAVIEHVAFGTSHVPAAIRYRMLGGFGEAFAFDAHGNVHTLAQLTPGRFLTTPGLWLGLLFAAAFLTAAVRLRRSRGPV